MKITQQLMESHLVLRHYKSKIFVCCLLVLFLQSCVTIPTVTNMESCVDNQQFITLHKKIENKQELSVEENRKYQEFFNICEIELLKSEVKKQSNLSLLYQTLFYLLVLTP